MVELELLQRVERAVSLLGERQPPPLELAGLVERTFEQARERYGGDAWSPMVVKLLEDALATDLRAAGFPERIESGLGD